MKIPVLTYHSMRIHGNEYASNDLVALAADLETFARRGFRMEPLAQVVRNAFGGEPRTYKGEKVVALTCDDGGDFDFHDLPHPTWGRQRSVLNILRDFRERHPARQAHITSFVIVSPEARTELDKSCMVGRGWWTDTWWREAASSGLMDIGNHSWDHNHDALPERFSNGSQRGTFRSIANRELADHEIRQAHEALSRLAPNRGNALFAYPYGETNEYLLDEYFPSHGLAMGIEACAGDRAECLHAGSPRWNLPRFVHGRDWSTPQDLERLLDEAAR